MTAGRVTPASDVHQPVFDHLERLTDDRGLFEHALLAVPRREHGYCVDDVARGLVVVCREPGAREILSRELSKRYDEHSKGSRANRETPRHRT